MKPSTLAQDTGTPVSENYDVPFTFMSKIVQVVVSLGATKPTAADVEPQQRVRAAMDPGIVGGGARAVVRRGPVSRWRRSRNPKQTIGLVER